MGATGHIGPPPWRWDGESAAHCKEPSGWVWRQLATVQSKNAKILPTSPCIRTPAELTCGMPTSFLVCSWIPKSLLQVSNHWEAGEGGFSVTGAFKGPPVFPHSDLSTFHLPTLLQRTSFEKLATCHLRCLPLSSLHGASSQYTDLKEFSNTFLEGWGGGSGDKVPKCKSATSH